MRSRLLAAAAAAWAAVFIVLAYVMFHPQPWYVVMVTIAGLLALFAAIFGTDGRGYVALLFALGILVVATLLGGWTAGPVLLPAVIGCAFAVKTIDRSQTGAPG